MGDEVFDTQIIDSLSIGNPDPFLSVIRSYKLVDTLRAVIQYGAPTLSDNWENWASYLNQAFGKILDESMNLDAERAKNLILKNPPFFKCWQLAVFPDMEAQGIRLLAYDIVNATKDIDVIRKYNALYDQSHAGLNSAGNPINLGTESPASITFKLNTGGE